MDAFDAMPLAALLTTTEGHRFLAVHGGISATVATLDDINAIQRFSEPKPGTALKDLLWSDPFKDLSVGDDPRATQPLYVCLDPWFVRGVYVCMRVYACVCVCV